MNLFARLLAYLAPGRSPPAAPPAPEPPGVPVFAVGEAPQAPPTAAAGALTPRDRERLRGVHPDLVRVVERARRETAFTVIEGVRTQERQRELVAKGASLTMNSRHITGHAVDLGPMPLDWQDIGAFRALAAVVNRAADAEGITVRWGGTFRDARGRPWFDGPHFELPREKYPG